MLDLPLHQRQTLYSEWQMRSMPGDWSLDWSCGDWDLVWYTLAMVMTYRSWVPKHHLFLAQVIFHRLDSIHFPDRCMGDGHYYTRHGIAVSSIQSARNDRFVASRSFQWLYVFLMTCWKAWQGSIFVAPELAKWDGQPPLRWSRNDHRDIETCQDIETSHE